ncbi:hypothetical protein SAMN04487904_106258 [Actinopolyspora lacussalsi subsp. righensis]|uniref:Uncharacterized protein n=1 Tax=Actinopolyspora righensis TaxID=995060 RepID=A0A1I7ACF8_9ACTN|nr:hypothetical protein SAMN04487904_106258 [Actinopolyspora righensis]
MPVPGRGDFARNRRGPGPYPPSRAAISWEIYAAPRDTERTKPRPPVPPGFPVVPVGAGESSRARSGDQNAVSSISISELSVFSTIFRREESSGSTFLAKNRTAATLPL